MDAWNSRNAITERGKCATPYDDAPMTATASAVAGQGRLSNALIQDT